jgi:hypothetical protein
MSTRHSSGRKIRDKERIMGAGDVIQSGLMNMCKSLFNIDPEEMRHGMVVFQNLIGEIHLGIKAIREEQAALRALLERMDNRIGGLDGDDGAGRSDEGARRESSGAGNGVIKQIGCV